MPSNNCDYPRANLDRQRGFTLIELLVTIAIIGIIASIGWSYYNAQKLRGYRSDAVIALTTLAQLEEQHMNNNGSYTTSIATLNPPASAVSTTGLTRKNAYKIAITIPQNTNTTTTTTGATSSCTVSVNGTNRYYCYQITATAIGGQTKDTQCAYLYLDNKGKRWSTDGSGGTTTGCWSK